MIDLGAQLTLSHTLSISEQPDVPSLVRRAVGTSFYLYRTLPPNTQPMPAFASLTGHTSPGETQRGDGGEEVQPVPEVRRHVLRNIPAAGSRQERSHRPEVSRAHAHAHARAMLNVIFLSECVDTPLLSAAAAPALSGVDLSLSRSRVHAFLFRAVDGSDHVKVVDDAPTHTCPFCSIH